MKIKKSLFAITAAMILPMSVSALEHQAIFDKAFPTGKLEIKTIEPTFHSAAETLVIRSFQNLNLTDKYEGYTIYNGYYDLSGELCNANACIDVIITDGTVEETYMLPIYYVGVDEKIENKMKPYFDKFKGTSQVVEENLFLIEDLEIINYMLVGGYSAVIDSQSTRNAAINYSTKFNKLLDNKNITAMLETRAGWDETFTHGGFGDLLFIYNDTIYGMVDQGGIRGSNIIYVPESTEKNNDAYIKAALERIEKYIGKNKVSIKVGDKLNTIDETDYMFPMNKIADLSKTLEDYYIVTINGEDHKFLIVADDEKMQKNPKVETNDFETNVSIETDDSEVPLDSKIKSKKYDKESKEYKELMKKLKKEHGMVYDIDLYTESLSKFITKIEDGKFLVRVPIDKRYEGKTLIAYYVREDGTIEPHTVTPKNGYAVFETDHFSTYTIVEVESSEGGTGGSESVPETGDNIIMYVSLMLISGLTSLVILKKQKN